MEPREESKQRRFRIEKLEERIAPAHVSLPASPGHVDGPLAAPGQGHRDGLPTPGAAAAADHNPHFSGKLRPLPVSDPTTEP